MNEKNSIDIKLGSTEPYLFTIGLQQLLLELNNNKKYLQVIFYGIFDFIN